jgi:hypothetical protein
MSTPVRAGDRDLRALARIVSEDRPDLPAEGLPPSLLADVMGQIRCDALSFDSWDRARQMCWFAQELPSGDAAIAYADLDQVFWEHYWTCRVCSYEAGTGDLHSVITMADFYATRQWHSTGMHTDHHRPLGIEHNLLVCLPSALPRTVGPGRHVRLGLICGPGPDFSERDRAVLTFPGPHLDQAFRDAERRRHPVPPAHPPAAGPAAPAGRRAHQHPDRPPPGHLRGNRAHPPGERLRTAGRLQSHRRRHPCLPRPGCAERPTGRYGRRLGATPARA